MTRTLDSFGRQWYDHERHARGTPRADEKEISDVRVGDEARDAVEPSATLGVERGQT